MSYTNGLDNPSLYFNTKLYTGTEVSGNSITGVGFQPDFIWIKNRTDATNHNIYDSVRGGNGTSHYWLKPNSTSVEATNTSSLLTIDSDGFTLGDGNEVNGNPDNIVSWNWLADNTSGSSNTDGSITSTVSANTTSGFSIVSYTGTGANATVGHGLGAVPQMLIVKDRSSLENWRVYHASLGNTKEIYLDITNASFTSPTTWNNTTPTSSVFSIGTVHGTNKSSDNYIAYCFAEKKGYSKFGSYTGNGGNQFIYTGFKPAFVIEKRSSNTSEWDMYDNKRNTFNSVTKVLRPDASSAEATYSGLNFLSNGFEATGALNDSGQTLIYMAFAESPFVTSTGIPTTAR